MIFRRLLARHKSPLASAIAEPRIVISHVPEITRGRREEVDDSDIAMMLALYGACRRGVGVKSMPFSMISAGIGRWPRLSILARVARAHLFMRCQEAYTA